MNLPEDGRIVVIDDALEEALPLISILSKNGVPTIYLTGEYEKLPHNGMDFVRILFLDLKLVSSIDEKSVIGTLVSILTHIIKKDNGPYFIILWSKHEKDYKTALENKFSDQSLMAIKPLTILSLKKDIYLERDSNGNWIFKNDAFERIEEKLKEELGKIGMFHLFIIWENLVHRAAGKIVNEFSGFRGFDEDWNQKMAEIFLKLAESYAGRQLNMSKFEEVIRNSLFSFNASFLDTLESEIRNFNTPELNISFEKCRSEINGEVAGEINSKLLIVKEVGNSPLPGNVYKFFDIESISVEELNELLGTMCYDFIDPIKVCKKFAIENDKNVNEISEDECKKINEAFKKDFGKHFKEERQAVKEQTQLVVMEISPYCDYAQEKWKVHRMLKGLLWPHDFREILKNADFIYYSPLINYENKLYYMVFDLRHFSSIEFDRLNDKMPLFRIRHELLVDIQSILAAHVSRPGVMFVE